MTEEWDKPSAALAKIAALESSPLLRACNRCKHRHGKGEKCYYPRNPEFGDKDQSLHCECSS